MSGFAILFRIQLMLVLLILFEALKVQKGTVDFLITALFLTFSFKLEW
jgi:hypothetical protein